MIKKLNQGEHYMRFITPLVRRVSTGLWLACVLAITGCDQTQPPAAKTPASTTQADISSAPADNMASTVMVKGDETLPPNHPPLPQIAPPHPTNAANSLSNLDRQLASQHPKPNGKKKLNVSVPDGVKGQWAAATLAVTVDGAENQLKLSIGDTVSIGENLQLHLAHYLPAYTSDMQTVTSSSNEQRNPAVQVQAISNGQVVAEGWVFQKLPQFNSYRNKQVKVRLISAERAQNK